METAPARIIVHVFAKKPLSPDQYKRLRAQTAQTIAAQGRQLVDLVIDTGPPKRDPADHETLRRIARGEADAPDIDGRVYVRGSIRPGEFARVRIVGATDYDLIAEPVRG